MFRIKRVQDQPAPDDGSRYLVDRLWPRGISRERAALTGWLKDLAPSAPLRVWFGHDPARWEEFSRRYREELAEPQAVSLLDTLRAQARHETVTLLFAARDQEHNHALVLKAVLEEAG